MRNKKLRPGQLGDYWPSKKPGRQGTDDPWCLTWYDPRKRQTRHESLDTTDFEDACRKVAEHSLRQTKPQEASPNDVSIASCLISYWEEYAKGLPSYRSIRADLRKWAEFWDDQPVSALSHDNQRKFRTHLGEGRISASSIDKMLSTGKAALNYAVSCGVMAAFPKIRFIETAEQKRARPTMGTPITPINIAKLLDAAPNRRLFVFIIILANTLARNQAALDLRREQYDEAEEVLSLNPVGRRQNKKFRATVPVTPTLKRWLTYETDPKAHYITYNGSPVHNLNLSWRKAVKSAGLPRGFTPYSFRHGVARELRRRKVPREQISLLLGHMERGAARTTSIYAPLEPRDCSHAVEALEDVMNEVRKHLKSANLDDPATFPESTVVDGKLGRFLSRAKKEELFALIRAGRGITEIMEKIGISSTMIYRYRNRLTGSSRNIGPTCVHPGSVGSVRERSTRNSFTDVQKRELTRLISQGASGTAISRQLGVARTTVYKYRRKLAALARLTQVNPA